MFKRKVMKSISEMTDDELEDVLMDLCGRLELDDDDISLLYEVEEERERRFKHARDEGNSKA